MENENKSILTTEKVDSAKKETKKIFGFIHKHHALAALLLIVFAVCAVLSSGLLAYKYGVSNVYLNKLTSNVPYPAVLVNYRIVSLHDYYKELENFKLLVAKQQPELTSEQELELKETVMDKLIHDKVIMQLADKFDVKLSYDDIAAEKEKAVTEIGGTKEEVDSKFLEAVGIDFDTFFNEMVLSSVYQERVAEKYAENEDIKKEPRKLAQEVLKLVQKGKESFEDLAKKYSQDSRFAPLGGEVGWVSADMLPKALQDAVMAMEVGDTSDLIETEQGFHIIKITDKRSEGGDEAFVYDIFIRISDFEAYLVDYISNSKVRKFVK
ncbi:MAG TPA: peptidylprolyl isomerase [Candidatus Bipolaricaulota bacterium]|nr:peptidylprolyl isomerase [Candidatus Bipolaricaulota bacterium]